jgi:protein SCO1/2
MITSTTPPLPWTRRLSLCVALAIVVPGGTPSRAETSQPSAGEIGFDQRLGERLPGDVTFRDETGAVVNLRDLWGRMPIVLLFGYTRCPQLCSVVDTAAVGTWRNLTATAGRDFAVLYISIDPSDGPRELLALKRRDLTRYGRNEPGAGWHYLSGTPRAIERITAAAGFRFTRDPVTRLYAHPSGFVVVTPDGRLSRYFLGVDFAPREVAAALEQAAKGNIGSRVFALLLRCARGLGVAGKYGPLIWLVLEFAVGLTIVTVFGGIGWMLWQERRAAASQRVADESGSTPLTAKNLGGRP